MRLREGSARGGRQGGSVFSGEMKSRGHAGTDGKESNRYATYRWHGGIFRPTSSNATRWKQGSGCYQNCTTGITCVRKSDEVKFPFG
jgi:hypothetical protein